MIVLGIDPGSRFLGFGLVHKKGSRVLHLENGTLYLDKIEPYTDRLSFIFDQINELIRIHKPDHLAIENLFHHKNPKSLQKLSEVRGVVLCAAAQKKLPIGEYTPLQVKRAVTGFGAATKQQMQYMVKTLLNLRDLAEENASDALGIALCHAMTATNLTKSKDASYPLSLNQQLLKKSRFYRAR